MRRKLIGLVLSGAVAASTLGIAAVTAHAASTCLPNPGAACGWDTINYGGAKIYGNPAPYNGLQDTFTPSNWNRLRSFKNRSSYTACPMNNIGGTTWEYLDLLVPLTNYPNLPLADKKADAVWYGVGPGVSCF
jgi:hypothetical protein